jgi:hypothetical protein
VPLCFKNRQSQTEGEKKMSDETKRIAAVQNTGNPVFDATVNVVIGAGTCAEGNLRVVHATLLELYGLEPAKPKTVTKTAQQWADEAKAS